MSTFEDVMGPPVWKAQPVLVHGRRQRRGHPAGRERQFAARMGATTIEVDAGHLAMVSHPDDVVKLSLAAVGGL